MNKYQINPLKTRADLVRLAVDLIEPLLPCLSEGKARLHIGDTGAVYDEAIAGMEGFSRVLWALVPMLAGKCPEAEPLWALWREGIVNGVDPDHPEYWGDIGPFDQRMVEMAVMGMALCMIPDRFYYGLPEDARQNLYKWLNQINHYDMPQNNWLFFRVLVNCGFLSVGLPADEKRLADDLDSLETHYCGDGWYYDKPAQRDYYTLWAFHYYGLVYARFMGKRDPERAARFIDRARQIAPRFAAWFDGEGRALPYGRSLTYRFAQGAFWSACALSGVTADGLGWGAVKGLLLKNLRWWMKQPIFDRDGILTIGYGYPNLIFAEGYNAPGSPYWAMKVFAVLALPEDHPFWQAEEEAYAPPRVLLDEQARLLLTRDAENRSVIAYTAGNHAYEHAHEDEKYEKFAYSTRFAFSAAKEAGTLKKGAFDSMLALKGERGLWHARSGFDRFELSEAEVSFAWRPMDGVEIETRLIPWENWHLRCHTVRTDRPLEAAEGGFAVCRDFPGARPCDRVRSAVFADDAQASVRCDKGSCAIFALSGYDGGEVVEAEPNTSLMVPRTLIPTLRAKLLPGTTRLVCAVCATEDGTLPETIPQEVTRLAQQCL
ncbi:MAG: DUF2264 domain-containing protein [Clostridia bacterium]|nr:DUF2264 domain-containing protein [Clostridia bacterium]